MYSVVLMMALTGSADTPAFGGGCRGGGGCYGGGGGCYGGGGGCHGKRGGGLFGGGCHGGGGLFRKGGRGCHGGGGCSGYGGGCYGGGWSAAGCNGVPCGCTGYSGHGCMGAGAGAGCHGGGPAMMPPPPAGGPEKVKPPKPEKGAINPNSATILVSLPAEAKLTVDGAPTTSTSATRLFVSPALETGKEYYYTLQADITRDGKPLSISKRVTVHAGEETRVTFEAPVVSVAQN
jgi:uncharacterized protein (TIGR03000 family)